MLARFEKEKQMLLNLFNLFFNYLKNREGVGERREPLTELPGGLGGGAAPPKNPRQKNFIF